MPRRTRIAPDHLEKEAEFDRAFPGWQEVITGQAPPYDEVAHQAFKHRYRAQIAQLRVVVDHCQQCKSTSRKLVADPTQDYTALRGLVCRPCRAKLVKIHVDYWPHLPHFWMEYCKVHCHRGKEPESHWCPHHLDEAYWWVLASQRQNAVAPPAPEI